MIIFNKVTKKYKNGFIALEDIDLTIEKQEFVFITGTSGAGKTTLLRLLIQDITPTSGDIRVAGVNITKLSSKKSMEWRRKIGTVFQDFKLLMDRTVYENIALTLEVIGKQAKDIQPEVEKVLIKVGLERQKDLFPLQLSGGESQRTVIARALIKNPEILLADEPTGNLDPKTSWEIIKLLEEINKGGTTVIMATHNADIVNALKKRVITLDKGKVKQDQKEGKYV